MIGLLGFKLVGDGKDVFLSDAKVFKFFCNSTKDGGFGIGAYEAQMLAQQMGGRIEVESTEGVGSVFTLLLPLADPKAHDTTIIKDEAA